MAVRESLRGFVNTWACDENAHLNVQFYFGFFEDAAEHFLAEAGVDARRRPTALCRHVRFHAELASGQLVRIDTHAMPGDAPGRWHLVHGLREPATGLTAATAFDTYDGPAGEAALAHATDIAGDEARPRSLTASPARIEKDGVPPGDGLTSLRGRIGSSEIDRFGQLSHTAVVARFSDANAHVWESVGAVQPLLLERRLGRVAVEMKVTIGARVGPGLFHMKSWPIAAGGKTLMFRHALVATDTGEVAALGDVTALLVDLDRRRAIALPADIRAEATARIG